MTKHRVEIKEIEFPTELRMDVASGNAGTGRLKRLFGIVQLDAAYLFGQHTVVSSIRFRVTEGDNNAWDFGNLPEALSKYNIL